jgi:hypothetical protein
MLGEQKSIINIFYLSHLLVLVKVEVVLVKVEDDFPMEFPLKLIICIKSRQKIGGNPEILFLDNWYEIYYQIPSHLGFCLQ